MFIRKSKLKELNGQISQLEYLLKVARDEIYVLQKKPYLLQRDYRAVREGDDLVVNSGGGYEIARAKTPDLLRQQLEPKLVTITVCEEL